MAPKPLGDFPEKPSWPCPLETELGGWWGWCREAGATLRDVGEEGPLLCPSRWENVKNVAAAADSGDPQRQSLDVLFDHHKPLRPGAPIWKGAKLSRVPQPASANLLRVMAPSRLWQSSMYRRIEVSLPFPRFPYPLSTQHP